MIAQVKVFPVQWGQDATFAVDHLLNHSDGVRVVSVRPVIGEKDLLVCLVGSNTKSATELWLELRKWPGREVEVSDNICREYYEWADKYIELEASLEALREKGAGI